MASCCTRTSNGTRRSRRACTASRSAAGAPQKPGSILHLQSRTLTQNAGVDACKATGREQVSRGAVTQITTLHDSFHIQQAVNTPSDCSPSAARRLYGSEECHSSVKAAVRRRDVLSLRDVRPMHLPLLRNIRNKGQKVRRSAVAAQILRCGSAAAACSLEVGAHHRCFTRLHCMHRCSFSRPSRPHLECPLARQWP